MKVAQVDKLYPKLTNHELATLAFEALVRGDDNERVTILDSVKHLNYQTLHHDFKLRFQGYLNLAGYYGLIYWKTRTYMAVADIQYKKKQDKESQAALYHQLDSLAAMETALQVVCAKHNLDVSTVKRYALCADEATISLSDVDQEQVEEFERLFSELVD